MYIYLYFSILFLISLGSLSTLLIFLKNQLLALLIFSIFCLLSISSNFIIIFIIYFLPLWVEFAHLSLTSSKETEITDLKPLFFNNISCKFISKYCFTYISYIFYMFYFIIVQLKMF